MNSIQSDALEPTRDELAGQSLAQRLIRLAPVYGLVILTVFLIGLFSILLPNTFPTLLNLRAILSDKAIIALLSLAAMIPMVAGRIDLTVGYGIVLWHILAISFQVNFGMPWPAAVAIVIMLGAITGVLNGILVEEAKIDAIAGVLLASKLRIGQASVGLEFLLPALVGAFLGSTTIKPGRVNVWGTIIGVTILAIGISGIQQFGGSFWVEPLFNGATLLIAIGIAGYAQRKKGAARK